MEKCNIKFNNNNNNNNDKYNNNNIRHTTQISELCSMERSVISESIIAEVAKIYRKYCLDSHIDMKQMSVFDLGGDYAVIYAMQGKVFLCTRNIFKKRTEGINANEDCKFVNTRIAKRLCLVKPKMMKKQVLGNICTNVYDMCTNMISTISTIKYTLRKCDTMDFKLLLIDMLSLIIEIRDGYITAGKVTAMLLRLYTAYHRFRGIFVKQSFGVNELLLGYAALGLPAKILDSMRLVTMLTGKKTLDTDNLISMACSVLDTFSGVINFFANLSEKFLPPSLCNILSGTLSYFTTGLRNFRTIKKVTEIYTRFLRNEQAIFDPSFREEVISLHKECVAQDGFLEYVTNVDNRYFKTTWDNFEQNVYKGVKMFDESRRDEPICLVFEGKAGSGKSALMNSLVDLLRVAGKSVYVHSVPSTMDAKDFYDDYENQDVFVMDDVGQQGKSQWRYIINFVAPTKYPLPCAQANKKNTKFFNSKIILCTTNHLMDLDSFTSTDCISDPDALRRRCHVIRVDRAEGEGFCQDLRYFKYSHMAPDARWLNEFLYHNAHIDAEVRLETSKLPDTARMSASLRWIYRILTRLLRNEEHQREISTIDDKAMINILREENSSIDANVFHDVCEAQSGSVFVNALLRMHDGKRIATEWFNHYSKVIIDMIKSFLQYLTDSVQSMIAGIETKVTIKRESLPSCLQHFLKEDYYIFDMVHVAVGVAIFSGVAYAINAAVSTDDSQRVNFWKDWNDAKQRIDETMAPFTDKLREHSAYRTQSERTDTISKFVKLIEMISTDGEVVYTHGVVSGNRLLIPCHVNPDCHINIYSTMSHFENGHREGEGIKLETVMMFPSVDLAVYKLRGVLPLYKKCKNLFINRDYKSRDLYLINSMGAVPVKTFVSATPNQQEISYDAYVIKRNPDGTKDLVEGVLTHEPWSGFITPMSGAGLCGTVLASESAGIMAFHVAGSSGMGFMIMPDENTRHVIRDCMLEGGESPFEMDNKVIKDFSGARMRYEPGQVKTSYVSTETHLVETGFNTSCNDDVKDLIATIEREQSIKLDVKAPPNFHALGSQKTLLEALSKKTFKHQGDVTDDELVYIGKCINSMMVDFSDVSDYDAAFGSDDLAALNKDSSNGYGWESEKSIYFDFEHKNITPLGRQMIDEFKMAAETENYDPKYYMCRETFKDELRKETKVNEPRTFRVMPLPHIFWTKKLCGDLMPHFKKNMHKFGCCIGLNPYTDFAEIHRKLTKCAVTGDIDFAKWDGSIVAVIMEEIIEIFKRHYKGPHQAVLDYVTKTMTRSMVLVGDSVWATTHGLPSGTWLTLLMNCLINKALTALTIYRNKPKPVIEDFYGVVDYVMGDDKIFGASNKMAPFFNLETINRVATQLGMTCTNGDKTPITQQSQPLNKLTFIKRKFVFHPELNRIIGALDLSTLVNTIQWRDAKKDQFVVMSGKMRSVQVEAFIHGRGVYELFKRLFNKYKGMSSLFSDDEVIGILNSKVGYIEVLEGLGKNVQYLLE